MIVDKIKHLHLVFYSNKNMQKIPRKQIQDVPEGLRLLYSCDLVTHYIDIVVNNILVTNITVHLEKKYIM